jgi:tetratricopeptide (TPR) repeat protein
VYRGISCAAAALLVTIAVHPGTADDASACNQVIGAEAIAACTRLLALNPNNAVAYYDLGTAYVIKGEYDRAISDLDQAIRLDPNLAMAYNNRGGVYENKGDYDRAISDYDQAIQLDPNYAAAYNNRGNAYRQKGE